MRRITRLTNGFSKKVGNHAYAAALHSTFYNFNFVRIYKSLRVTPAMAAEVEARPLQGTRHPLPVTGAIPN